MQYIQVTFSFPAIEDYKQDLLIAALADIGFNTFEDAEQGFSAFTDAPGFDEANLRECLTQFEGQFEYTYTVTEIAAENWNETWEKNFEPLIIDDQCYVRATFHEARPEFPFEIVIDPKMAFGTGHHQTTTMMMQFILETDFTGKTVLDMGCGTGILAILASKKGAKQLTAIDNDPVCFESTKENAALNNIQNILSLCGGKEAIPSQRFDIILANINRNILLDQIADYNKVLNAEGQIFFSGFYEDPDLNMIKAECFKYNIEYKNHKKIGDWVAAHFQKK